MLEFELHVPDGASDGAPVLVLLHGRGSHKGDLMSLQPELPPATIVVTPQAPFPGAPWGYGGGWAWYKYLGGTTPEPETFEEGQAALREFLQELPNHLPVKPGFIMLGGFSQGATTALAYALRHGGDLDGVMVLSGFLASHPSVEATPQTVSNLRIFWAHGKEDPMIPFAYGEEGRAALRAANADLTIRDYPIGHWIDQAELRDASDWLRGAIDAATDKKSVGSLSQT